MGLNFQMTQLLEAAAGRYRDKKLEDKYLSIKETICMIAYVQYTGLDKRIASVVDDECKSVLACADHVIVDMLFRAERVTGVRAELWRNETSPEALARRDFIHSRVDAKMKPLLAARAARRLRFLI
jgi:hypothetical protein